MYFNELIKIKFIKKKKKNIKQYSRGVKNITHLD